MKNWKNIRNQLKLFKYKDYRFDFHRVKNSRYFELGVLGVTTCAVTNKTFSFRYPKIFSLPENTITTEYLKECVWDLCWEWETHEIKEFLKFNGKYVKNPHPKDIIDAYIIKKNEETRRIESIIEKLNNSKVNVTRTA